MIEPELTDIERAAAVAMSAQTGDLIYVATSRKSLNRVARAVVAAVEPLLTAEHDRRCQENLFAATHALVTTRGEVERLKHRAAAIEPDTSLLKFLAKEDEL